MASAALNSGLLEALVSRGTTPHAPGRDAHPRPPPSPNTAGEDPAVAHHAYLHAHFQAVASHYAGGGDLHEMSTSGGDATTEDDDASLNDQLVHFYSKSSLGDDLLSASAKKRRKQSKPVRLPTPQGDPGDAQEQKPIKTEETQFDSEMSNHSAEGDEGFTCSYCHLQAPSDDSLRRHIIEEHIGRLLSDDEARQQQLRQEQESVERLKSEEGATPLNLSSPRWEGGGPPSRPQEEDPRSPPTSIPMPPSFGDMKLNLPGLLPLGPPHFLLPFLQQAEHERLSAGHPPQNSSPSSSANGQQHRIFNQQAYCDLCNKEFCNKYFLKTHKANKHGIYSPEFSSSPTGMTTGHTTPLGPSVPLASPLGPSLGSGGLVGSPYAGAFIAATMNNLPLRPPLLPTHPGASKPMPMAKTEPSGSSGSSSSKAGGVINLEAYCELCQKEFCNKYFLKRHKSKIHGITIDVVTKPKNPGQVPVRVAPDRPEGWCDACRRDIGGRAALNAHKLQAHGPHIVAPLPSPHNTSPHSARNPRTPTPNDGRKSSPDHRDPRDYFTPWESLKDPREQGREPWDSGKDPSRDTPARSPWERPLGSPWDVVRELPRAPDCPRVSPKDNIQKSESWSKHEHRNNDQYNHRDDRGGPLPSLERLSDSHEFPLDARDMQAMREEQQREWEMQQRELEQQHRERVQQQYLERERQHREREREMQQRERDQWERERERERELYREQQFEREQYEREQRERILLDRQREFEQQQEQIKRENQVESNREPLCQDGERRHCERQQSEAEAQERDKGERNGLQHGQEDIGEHQDRVDGREGESQKQEGDSVRREEGSENREDHNDREGELDVREKGYEGREGGPETREGGGEGQEESLGGREGSLGGREGSLGGREGSLGGREGSLEGRETGLDGRDGGRDPLREGHRTPGGSSADESSRDTGIIARVGQPAMVQAPPGTKFTPEQLRQLGVINPDAFCELCCKEFCNKYFLRTHRIKKHGIYTPEFSDRSKSQQKENSPMNLARLLERQALYARPTLPDIENDLECDLCRRPFPSSYLLQMHKYYFHGSGQEAGHQEQLNLHPHQSPHEQLRQLALHAQQQARQQQQQHQKRMQEQQKQLEHQQRLQKQEDEQREQARLERERPTPVPVSEEGQTDRGEDLPRPSVIESAGSGESDASEDLRKLQSMILQLNRQGEMGLRCRLCNKDVGNKYFLRAHMMTEHGILGHDEVSAPPSEGAQTPKTPRAPTPKVSVSPPSTPLSGENQAFCNICKKDFFSRYILQQHMLSAHGVFTPPAPPTSFMERIRAEVESREERKPQSTSRSYCEICNKELCNKYFMKTHMLKMHGINVENGVSGGVTCDLCNKELCSKYFLRVHKQNTHGMVEEGREGDEGIVKSEIESCPLCPRRFKNRKWLKTHLTSDHDDAGKEKWREIEASVGEREGPQQKGPACGLCGHVLPDIVALQLHVIKMHGTPDVAMDTDPQTQEDPKTRPLQCSVCPFTAPSPALLFAHARTHAPGMPPLPGMLGQTLPCPLCSQVLPGLEAYQHHLLQHQLQGLLKPLLDKEDHHPQSDASRPFKAPEESNEEAATRAPPAKRRKRWRCSQCSRRFKSRSLCLAHVHATHNPRARGTWLGRPAVHRRLFKCRKCGAVAQRLTALRQHIREQHRVGPGVPTTHATPTKPRAAGRFVMQPFLLNNEGSEGGEEGEKEEERGGERRQFVPSLVYLPVARRVHRPLTVSFSLTPA